MVANEIFVDEMKLNLFVGLAALPSWRPSVAALALMSARDRRKLIFPFYRVANFSIRLCTPMRKEEHCTCNTIMKPLR